MARCLPAALAALTTAENAGPVNVDVTVNIAEKAAAGPGAAVPAKAAAASVAAGPVADLGNVECGKCNFRCELRPRGSGGMAVGCCPKPKSDCPAGCEHCVDDHRCAIL